MLNRTVPVLTFALALSMSSAGYALGDDDDETEVELSGTIDERQLSLPHRDDRERTHYREHHR